MLTHGQHNLRMAMPNATSTELRKLLDELERSAIALSEELLSEQVQQRVCLDVRSAYLEFFSVSEFEGYIDSESAERLRAQFQAVLRLLPIDGRCHISVSERFEEFANYCQDLGVRDEVATAV